MCDAEQNEMFKHTLRKMGDAKNAITTRDEYNKRRRSGGYTIMLIMFWANDVRYHPFPLDAAQNKLLHTEIVLGTRLLRVYVTCTT